MDGPRGKKGIGWFGIVTALLSFSIAIGSIARIAWLGGTGLGTLGSLAVPSWLDLAGHRLVANPPSNRIGARIEHDIA